MEENNYLKKSNKILPIFLVFTLVISAGLALLSFSKNSTANAAVAPAMITYQGKLLVSGLAATTTQQMYFTLFDSLLGGTALYTASGTTGVPNWVGITPSNGLFSVNLGDTGTNAMDPSVFRDNTNVYLEVQIGATVLSPRKRIAATPYAFNAKYLDGIAPSSTHPLSTYIPVTDAAGNINFNFVTSTALYATASSTLGRLSVTGTLDVTGANVIGLALGSSTVNGDMNINGNLIVNSTSTFATTTITSTTINVANITNGNITNATTTNLAVTGNATFNTITSGTWHGGVIEPAYGGTGQDSSLWTGFVKVTGGVWSTSTVAVNDLTGSTTLAYLNANNIFTGNNTFSGTTTLATTTISSTTLNTANIGNLFVSGNTYGININDIAGSSTLVYAGANNTFTGTTTFSTTTVASSTINTANIGNLYITGNTYGINLNDINGSSTIAYLGNNQTFSGINTFNATSSFTTTTVVSSTIDTLNGTTANIVSVLANSVTANSMTLNGVTITSWPTGSGGAGSWWVTSSDSLVGYPNLGAGYAIVIGANSTSSDAKFEVVGGEVIRGGGTLRVANGVNTTTVSNDSITVGAGPGYASGRFYTDSLGNVVAYGSLVMLGTGTSTFAGGLAVQTNKFVVDGTTGFVGVGTLAATDKLTVVDDSVATRGISVGNGSATTTLRRLGLNINVDPSNGAGLFLIDGSGNASASGTLRVFGDASFGTVASGTWNGNVIGTQYGGTATNTSLWSGFVKITAGVWGTSTIAVNDLVNSTTLAYLNNNNIFTGQNTFAGTTTMATTTIASTTIENANIGNLYVVGNTYGININNISGSTTLVYLGADNVFTGSNTFATTSVVSSSISSANIQNGYIANATTTNLAVIGNAIFNTISSGTWQGGIIQPAYGGTGQDTSLWSGFVRLTGGVWGTSTMSVSDLVGSTTLAYLVNNQTFTGLNAFTATATFGTAVGVGTTAPQQKLHVYDGKLLVDSPTTTRLVASVNVSGTPFYHDIDISGYYAYVGSNSSTAEVQIYDISKINSPVLAGRVDFDGSDFAQAIKVLGNYLYVGSNNYFKIFDISNLVSPKLLSNTLRSGMADIDIVGKYAYIAMSNKLEIYDISNPTSPVLVSSQLRSVLINSVMVRGNYAYLGLNNDAGGDELEVWDVSNVLLPVKVSGIEFGNDVQDTEIRVDHLFALLSGSPTMAIYNVADPTAPFLENNTTLSGSGIAGEAAGKYLIISEGRYIGLYDISDPTSPNLLTRYDGGFINTFLSIKVHGNYLFAGSNSAGTELRIYDLGGVETSFARIGNFTGDTMSISENANINNNLFVGNGVSVGHGGLLLGGNFGMSVSSTGGNLNIFGISVSTTDYANYSAFTVTDSGNIGIGTSTPTEKLTVNNGNIVVKGDTISSVLSSSTLIIAKQAGFDLGKLYINSAGDISTSGSLRVFGTANFANVSTTNISASGYLNVAGQTTLVNVSSTNQTISGYLTVGGPTLLTSTLAVMGTSTFGDIIPMGPYSGNMSQYNVGASTTRWNSVWAGVYNIGTSTWSLATGDNGRFGLYDSANGAGNERISVLTNGNVGIGTVAPSDRLTVAGGSMVVGDGTSTSTISGSGTSTLFNNVILAYNNGAKVGIGPLGLATVALDVDPDGLGYTKALSVSAAFTRDQQSYINILSSDDTTGVLFGDSSDPDIGRLIYDNNNDSMQLWTTNTERMRIDVNGNVGINSTSPGYTLAVGGTGFITGTTTVTNMFDNPGRVANPTVIGSYSSSSLDVESVSVQEDNAYVINLSGGLANLEIVNVSDSSNPTYLGSYVYGTGVNSMKVYGHYAYSLDAVGLKIVDVSNPTSTALVGSLGGTSGTDLEIVGNYLYILGGSNFYVADISDPADPALVSTKALGTAMAEFDINGRYAYCAGSGSLIILDISNPRSVVAVGSGGTGFGGPWNIVVEGNFAYLTTGMGGSGNIFTIMNVSKPNSPSFVTSTGGIGMPSGGGMYVSGDYVYFYAPNGLYIYNIASSTNPYRASYLSTGSTIYDIAASGGYLYIAAGFNSLKIVDVVGSRMANAEIGTAKMSNIAVLGAADFSKNLNIRGSLTVGNGGMLLRGDFGMSGAATNTLNFSSSTVLTSGVGNYADATAFILNASNLNGAVQNNLLDVQANGTPRFTVKSDGSVIASGSMTLGGLIVGDGTTTSTLQKNLLKIASTTANPNGLFFVDASGNVSVSGTLSLTNSSLSVVSSTVSDLRLSAGTSKNIQLWSNGSERVRIDSSGYVGVGTSTPQAKMHILDGTLLVDSPFNPTLVSSTNVVASIRDIFINGKFAYIGSASTTAEVSIYDIARTASPTFVGGINLSGPANSLVISGKYAFIGTNNNLSGGEFVVYDISNFNSPILVGSAEIGATVQALRISGNIAYVGSAAANEFQVFDISNPASPTLLSQLTFGATSVDGLFISGIYAYAAVNFNNNELSIIDISNPKAPRFVSSIDLNTATASEVYVSGKYAYVAGSLGAGYEFSIVDISNPASLQIVGGADFGNGVEDIWVAGKYAYLVTDESKLRIFDISDASSPFSVANFTLNGLGTAITISGKYAYVGTGTADQFRIYDVGGIDAATANIGNIASNDLTVWEDVSVGKDLYIGNGLNVGTGGILSQGNFGMMVSSTGANMAIFGVYVSTTASNNYPALAITDNGRVGIGTSSPTTALVVVGTSTLQDVAPMSPLTGNMSQYNLGASTSRWNAVWVGTVNIGTSTWSLTTGSDNRLGIFNGANGTGSEILSIATNGNVGVGTTTPQEKMHVYDGSLLVDTPVTARQLGFINYSVGSVFYNGIAVRDNLLYVGSSSSTAEFAIFDVTDASNPVMVSAVDITGFPLIEAVRVVGNYAYLGSNGNFFIYDISDPSSPVLKSQTATGVTPFIEIIGKYAYLGTGSTNEFRIYDISDPTAPVLISSTNATGLIYSAQIVGKYSYLGTADGAGNQEFAIYDVSDITRPAVISGVSYAAAVFSAQVRGRYAYLASASSTQEFGIYDISNPDNITFVSGVNLPAAARSVRISGKYAYLSGDSGNIWVYDISDPRSPFQVANYTLPATPIVYTLTISGKRLYVGSTNVNAVQIYDLGGVETSVASIGSLEGDNIRVNNNASIGNSLSVRNGLNVGPGGMMLQGSFGLAVSSTGSNLNIFGVSVSTTDAARYSAFTISDNGYVGIGTSSPGYDLDVGSNTKTSTSTLRLLAATNQDSQIKLMEQDDTFGFSLRYNAQTNRFGIINHNGSASGIEVLSILNNGNEGKIGIGTTSPVSILEVASSEAAATKLTISNGNAGNFDSQITFALSGTNAYSIGVDDSDGDKFKISSSSAFGTNDRLVINADGFVGIGDSSPDNILSILSSTAADTEFSIQNGNAGNYDPKIGFRLSSGNVFTMGVDDGNLDQFIISTSSDLGSGAVFQIEPLTGNVGMGYQSLTYALNVGRIDTPATINLVRRDTNIASGEGLGAIAFSGYETSEMLGVGLSAVAKGTWGASNAPSELQFFASGTQKMVLSPDGFLGIAVTSPSYALDVSTTAGLGYAASFFNDGNNLQNYGIRIQAGEDIDGTSYFIDAFDGNGDMVGYIANVAGTFALTTLSDVRSKTNIETSTLSGIDAVSRLRVVEYNKISNPDGPRITGFIAQEVLDIYPDAVSEGTDGMYGLALTKFIPVIVRAIQEQQTLLEPLSSTISLVGDNIIIGSSTQQKNLALTGTFSLLGNTENKIEFATGTLFESQVPEAGRALAYVLNASNFSSASTDDVILSLRSNNEPVFSVSASGDINALGDVYAKSLVAGSPGQPGDLAEKVDIAIDDIVEPGDVLVVDENSPDTYRKSRAGYEQAVAGVVSTNPTIVVGSGKTDYTAVMAMVGRVPVKVSAENGAISRGDLLVTASTTGYAMKYDSGKDNDMKMVGVIGVALEPLAEGTGKILALVRTGWVYNKNESIAALQQNVQTIAGIQGIDLTNGTTTTLSVQSESGSLVYNGGNLDLQGNALLNVASIAGKDNRWAISETGQFITRMETTVGSKEMYAMQSPTSEFVFSSSSQLSTGESRIVFDQQTQEIIDATQPLKITVTLTSGEAKGIYVSEKNATGFVVKELESGTSNATFDWMVVAKRRDSLTSASQTTDSVITEPTDQTSLSSEGVTPPAEPTEPDASEPADSAVSADPVSPVPDQMLSPEVIPPAEPASPAESATPTEPVPPTESAPPVESAPPADPAPPSEPAPPADSAPPAV